MGSRVWGGAFIGGFTVNPTIKMIEKLVQNIESPLTMILKGQTPPPEFAVLC